MGFHSERYSSKRYIEDPDDTGRSAGSPEPKAYDESRTQSRDWRFNLEMDMVAQERQRRIHSKALGLCTYMLQSITSVPGRGEFVWNAIPFTYYDPEVFQLAWEEQTYTEECQTVLEMQRLFLEEFGCDSKTHVISSSSAGGWKRDEKVVFEPGKSYFIKSKT